MKLTELLYRADYRLVGDDPEIRGFQYDSRKVEKGDVFFCLPGTMADGHDYAGQAIERGASAVVCNRLFPQWEIPQAICSDLRETISLAAMSYYGSPSDQMYLFGITGTNGKTSVSHMIWDILEYHGTKTGILGTIGYTAGEKVLGSDMTTPEPKTLHGLFRKMLELGYTDVAMEVSSHALEQKRVAGIEFGVAVYTNLTQDHLDYHGTMERYRESKKQLFHQCRIAVINGDDPFAKYMQTGISCPVIRYGINDKTATVRAQDIVFHERMVAYTLVTPEGEGQVSIGIPGEFTVYNSLGAIAACLAYGLTLEQVLAGAKAIKGIPGRAEVIETQGKEYTVLLDYSHTPDSLKNILTTIGGFRKGKIVTVFGCGGDRDSGKRSEMGRIAGQGSDYCIVTSDNPRTEEPMAIIRGILPGLQETGCSYTVIEDRKEAIRWALQYAEKDDIILLAGKGHETYQEINGNRNEFDEKKIVRQLLVEWENPQDVNKRVDESSGDVICDI